jgi:hypothetical protein
MGYRKKTDYNADINEFDNMVETEDVMEEIVKEKKVFKDSDYILCRSVWFGGLNVTCQSGSIYEFARYDSECEITYRDLVNLIRRHSEHIFMPRFVIEDDDFLEEFPNVRDVYNKMYTAKDLMNIINLPNNQMKAEIEKLPIEPKNTLCKMIATEIAKGHIDSISKVRVLSEIFESDFDLISKLFIK